MKNWDALVRSFSARGCFEGNILTFNQVGNENAQPVENFDECTEQFKILCQIQRPQNLKVRQIESAQGPASFD